MSLQAVKSHSRLSLSTQTKVSLRPRGILRVKAAGKVVREYREDDNTIVDARSKSQPASGDLYVQNVQAPVQKRMSKEQRSKLMEEYVGLGGSETKGMSQNWFLYMMVVVSVLAVACKMIGALG